ncbi:MAG: mandelate racemase/muconate lactonizing enzyme family protein [Salinirussus sp.]
MEIVEVEAIPIAIPLETPVSFATRTIHYRDHAITYVRTADGQEGVGYSLGYESADLIADAVNNTLGPLVEGEDPRDTERLYSRMVDGSVQVGRRGAFMRAISTVDIACWDVAAKAVETPLYKYLGAAREEIPAYASGGYYRDEKGHEGLRDEVDRYVRAGHDTIKMKVGRRPASDELERVRAVRETIGPERTLLMDANGAWDSAPAALQFCQAAAEFDPYFIEEPAMPDNIDLLSRINDRIDYAVATGELESTRYGFQTLLRAGAAGILQPDATVVGGITEWLKVANMANAVDVPIAPHYNWNLHVSLLCAIDNATWVEYFYRDQDVKVFDDVVADPIAPDNGMMRPPDRPGHGVQLDPDAIERFRGLPEGGAGGADGAASGP